MEEQAEADLTFDSLVHDLGNVFETIGEAAELLSADRHWKPVAATITRSVARGKRLLGSLPDRAPDLASVADGAIQSVTDYCVAARKPRMRLFHELPRDVLLPGSSKDWERVFVNLFLNAAQVLQKPGRIDIQANREAENWVIAVSDNGPGIPADVLPRLFRMRVSTKAKSVGRSGLGLQIVDAIVKKYGGRINAANRDRGTGAVFTITLPLS